MKKIVLLFCFIAAGAHLAAQNSDKVVRIQKFSETIRIDGMIDPAWAQADSISDFTQFSPYYNTTPSRKTIAKLFTTDNALYCLMVCYCEKKTIQAFKGKLDDVQGDIVSLMLDTFGNGHTAYKSLQYDESLSAWGLDFDRWIPKDTEDIYWCRYEENEGQRISKFGKLSFEDFRPTVKGIHLELYPVGIAKATYQGNNKYDVDPNAGIDIFYNPSSKLTFQLTANPDFAQIGTSANMFVEWNPDGDVEDITYNTRPFISATPVNNNGHMEVLDRVGVLKLKYLYYF